MNWLKKSIPLHMEVFGIHMDKNKARLAATTDYLPLLWEIAGKYSEEVVGIIGAAIDTRKIRNIKSFLQNLKNNGLMGASLVRFFSEECQGNPDCLVERVGGDEEETELTYEI